MQGDERLFNPYGIIAVNPTVVTGVNYEGAMELIEFFVSERSRSIIADYGTDRFGEPLFRLPQRM